MKELFEALAAGDLRKVNSLVNGKRISPNTRDSSGEPALHVAAKNGFTEAVQILLSAGGNPNIRNDSGLSALFPAVRGCHRGVVKKLLEAGANPNLKRRGNRRTVLFEAVKCRSGDIDILDRLLEAGADPELVDDSGKTPGDLLSKRHPQAWRDLLITSQELWRRHFADAIRNIDVDAIRRMLEEDPKILTRELIELGNDTPTQYALARGDEDLLAVLAEFGFSPKMEEAVRAGNLDVVAQLLDEGGNPDSKTERGESILFVAIQRNFVEIAQYLLEAGADPNCSDGRGRTGLFFAQVRGEEELVNWLVKKGATLDRASDIIRVADAFPRCISEPTANQELGLAALLSECDHAGPLEAGHQFWRIPCANPIECVEKNQTSSLRFDLCLVSERDNLLIYPSNNILSVLYYVEIVSNERFHDWIGWFDGLEKIHPYILVSCRRRWDPSHGARFYFPGLSVTGRREIENHMNEADFNFTFLDQERLQIDFSGGF